MDQKAPIHQPTSADPEHFIRHWRDSVGSQLATAQTFVIELCELLGVERRRVDCYKRGCFI